MSTNKKETRTTNVAGVQIDLPDLGFTGDDVRRQLAKTAQSGIEQIMSALEAQYHVRTIPDIVQKTLRTKAHFLYIRYCELLIDELKAAADDPTVKF